MSLTPNNAQQLPDKSILDYFNRQTYLGNTFSLPINGLVISGTSETPAVLIQNAQSTTLQGQKSIFSNSRGVAANSPTIFRYYLNPTITDIGTPAFPVNLRPASGTSSISTCSVSPTVSNNGTLVLVVSVNDYSTVLFNSLVVLDPGQSLLTTVQAITTGTTIFNENIFYEL
jgi:hypothetical protein